MSAEFDRPFSNCTGTNEGGTPMAKGCRRG
jgi:hypothetical protein